MRTSKVEKLSVSEYEDPLEFSDSAVAKVKILIEEEENDELKLRLYITGGGCAGFSYGFSFVEDVADDDTVITKAGVSLVVDAMSLQYLTGSEVDYREGLQGSQFLVNNPNATTTCGCGSSFSL
ncbi:MAG: iron-sulfur cluster insertion protein ErpA [Oceanospirillaceae bacterium]|nr:iron-sulfur cluster insertion protein ErpA [Oceanospirillaceae bacterium]